MTNNISKQKFFFFFFLLLYTPSEDLYKGGESNIMKPTKSITKCVNCGMLITISKCNQSSRSMSSV